MTSITFLKLLPGVALRANTLKLLLTSLSFLNTSQFACFPKALCASSITTQRIFGPNSGMVSISFCKICGVIKNIRFSFHILTRDVVIFAPKNILKLL